MIVYIKHHHQMIFERGKLKRRLLAKVSVLTWPVRT